MSWGKSSASGVHGKASGFGVLQNQGSDFNPASISGYYADFDASRLAGLNDGDAVSSFTDFVGGNNATASGTSRATFRRFVAGYNNKPALQFSGGQGYVTPTLTAIGSTKQLTIFVVGNASDTNDGAFIELSSNTNTSTGGFLVYRQSGNNWITSFFKGSDTHISTHMFQQPMTRPKVISSVFDRTLANGITLPTTGVTSYPAQSQVYVNGMPIYNFLTSTTNDAIQNENFGSYPAYIGARNQSTLKLTGYIARIIIYTRALTPGERRYIENGLNSLYNLKPVDGVVFFDGDSMTAATNATYPYPAQTAALVAATKDYDFGNTGISGQTTQVMSDYAQYNVYPALNGALANKKILSIFGGINDLYFGADATTTYNRIVAYH